MECGGKQSATPAVPRFACEFQGWDTIQSGVALCLPPHSIFF